MSGNKSHDDDDDRSRELPASAFALNFGAASNRDIMKLIDGDAHVSNSASSTSKKPAPRLQNGDIFSVPVDELLSRDLQNMTFEDRNKVYEEIHGVATLCPDETPELLQQSLRELQLAIDAIPLHDKPAYQEAQQYHDTYVNEEDFRLRFLRTELFDAKKAAQRMVKFLDLLKIYYGVAALQRPIRLSDFGKKEMECVKAGNHQFLPYRDRSGRRIMAVVTDFGFGFPIEVRIKMLLYMFWVVTDEVQTQRDGVVIINWPNREVPLFPERKEHVLGQQAFHALPLRIAALHMCLPDNLTHRLLKANVALIMGKEERKRIKMHLGERTELQYNLQSYGIYVDQIPVTETGNVKLTNLNQWLKVRRAIEARDYDGNNGSLDGSESIIECPGINDVVFRLGKTYLFHPGNIMFRSIIEDVFEAHDTASTQEEKVKITWSVIDRVQKEKHGRFLVWNNRGGWWTELTNRAQIRTKVAVYIREFKKRVKAMSNRQTSQSSTSRFGGQDGRKRPHATIVGNENIEIGGKVMRVEQEQMNCFWNGST